LEILEEEDNAQTQIRHCSTAKNIRNRIKTQITPLINSSQKRPQTSLNLNIKETRNHSFKDIDLVPIRPVYDPYAPKIKTITLDTNYQVIALKKPESLRWLRERRLMLFMQSSFYFEFKLAKILLEYKQKLKNGKKISMMKIAKIKLAEELNNENFNPL
jgi:hypothetical protein